MNWSHSVPVLRSYINLFDRYSSPLVPKRYSSVPSRPSYRIALPHSVQYASDTGTPPIVSFTISCQAMIRIGSARTSPLIDTPTTSSVSCSHAAAASAVW